MHKAQKNWGQYLGGIAAKLVMGYGENPCRVVGTSLVVILSGSLLYPLGFFKETAPESDPITYSLEGDPIGIVDSIYFSTMTFTTLSASSFQPIGWGRLIAMIQTTVGAILMAILVFVLARRATR